MTIWLCFGFRVAFRFCLWKTDGVFFFFRGFEESKIQLSHRCTSPVFGGKFAAQSSKRVQGLTGGITETLEIFILDLRRIEGIVVSPIAHNVRGARRGRSG